MRKGPRPPRTARGSPRGSGTCPARPSLADAEPRKDFPEQVVRVLDENKLIAAVGDNPALLEQVRSAVKAGDWKTPRLMIRDIPANEQE